MVVVASAVVEDIVRTVLDGQEVVVVVEATKAREAVFRDTNRVNAVCMYTDGIVQIANEKERFLS